MNYTQTTFFGPKDDLPQGDPLKVIMGAAYDVELAAIAEAMASKANTAGPTFTGTVTLPGTTSIGSVTAAELAYLAGVTSAIQEQINGKAASGHNHDSTYAALSHNHDGAYSALGHTHSYLPLAGGTLTGALNIGGGSAGDKYIYFQNSTRAVNVILSSDGNTFGVYDATGGLWRFYSSNTGDFTAGRGFNSTGDGYGFKTSRGSHFYDAHASGFVWNGSATTTDFLWYFGGAGPQMKLTSDGNLSVSGAVGSYTVVANNVTSIGDLKVGGAGVSGTILALLQNTARAVALNMQSDGVTIGLYDYGITNWRWYTDASGNFTATGNVTSSSDARLKENIADHTLTLDQIRALRSVAYDRKDNGAHQIGVLAQDVQAIAPECVLEDADGMLSVDYARLGVLVSLSLAKVLH